MEKVGRNACVTVVHRLPDVGNLSAWGNDVPAELKLGIDRIAAIHLKDTQPVTEHSPDSSAMCRLAKAVSILLASSKRCMS